MARLETQIHQIFLVHPETKTISQILYEEELNANSHLFLLAEIKDIARKSETEDLKKISEIILDVFRTNQKLPAETLFESSLAQINQKLADYAHKGRKSWVGKFSSVLALKSNDSLCLANTGQVSAWLKRKQDVTEILAAEKKSKHPLKTYQNFTLGKVKDSDSLILATANIFNYVSIPLFLKTLGQETLAEACLTISKILKESAGNDQAFAAFMLAFSKEAEETIAKPAPEEYAPLAEELAETEPVLTKRRFFGLGLPSFRMKLPSLPRINLLRNLSGAKKFFIMSFLIFLVLFFLNLVAFGFRLEQKKQANKINQQAAVLAKTIGDAESALIYKNLDQALKLLQDAKKEFAKLKGMDPQKAHEYETQLNDLSTRVNRVTVIENPNVYLELKYLPQFLARAGKGFLLAGSDTKSLTFFDGTPKLLFLLNNPSGEIRGIAHIPNLGHTLLSPTKYYLINEKNKQLDTLQDIPNADLKGLKFVAPNRIYTMDIKNGQVLRMQLSGSTVSAPVNLLKSKLNLADLKDFGVDKDVYVLYSSTIKKYTNGLEQSFNLAPLSDSLTDANKLFVASNLYVLESSKKRLIIYNKQGVLLNQIYFPSLSELKDLYVDELERNIYLLDNNKLLQITF